jgi:hypothetical protein
MGRIKSILLLIGLMMSLSPVKGQQIGNEWIDYSLDYYRIPVVKQGLHRITQPQLQAAGLPLSTLNPAWLRLYHRGEEVPLLIIGGDDGSMDTQDQILFMAKGNDGWFDEQLYDSAHWHLNKNYSLFNDTAVYFLTWEPIPGALRFLVEADFGFSGYTPIPYAIRRLRIEYPSIYYGGRPEASGVTPIRYVRGEGFFDQAISTTGLTRNIPTPSAYSLGPPASVRIAIVGASNYAGTTLDPLNRDHHLRIDFAGQLIDTLYDGYVVCHFQRNIATSSLGSSQTPFVFRTIDDIASPSDRNALAYIELDYPRTFSFSGESSITLNLPAHSSKSRLDINGFGLGVSDSLIIIDPINRKFIRTLRTGGLVQALVPAFNAEHEIFLQSSAQINTVISVNPVTANAKFSAYLSSAGTDYLIVSHPSLLQGSGAVNDYSLYRSQSGYQPLILNIEELYDQYAYGIRKHPMAIRNMLRDFKANYAVMPSFLFLIGKSYKAPDYRSKSFQYQNTLVPTMGYPPSDFLFSSGLGGGFAPLIATGRLSATSIDDVDLYLEKVMAHESAMLNPQPWMKKVLHFGGGNSIGEQNTLASYLASFKKTIEDTLYGGWVQTFLKSSTDPIQINQSTLLKQEIDGGVSLMTFYGHASGVGFDISTDQPGEYNNLGKYPLILANSCFAGDIFSEAGPSGIWSSSEEFLLIRDKGAIGYIASVSAASAGGLNFYSGELYRHLAYKSYGQPIGSIMRNNILFQQINAPYLEELCLDMTLHGDPAVSLPNQSLPDYVLDVGSIQFTPALVSSDMPSFSVQIISQNIGRAVGDSMIVELSIRRPDNTTTTLQQQVASTRYRDTIDFVIPIDPVNHVGINYFRARLDAFNSIPELSELNNQNIIEVPLNIRSADILPVLPVDDALEPVTPILIASTLDPFAPQRAYLWNIDTTDSFNSPLKQSHQALSAGGILQWQPTLPLSTDSVVYYWRVSPDSSGGQQASWRTRSFQVINGSKGWAQSHIFQFAKDDYNYVNYSRLDRGFEFVNDIRSLHVQTGYYPFIPFTEEWYRLDGVVMGAWNCASLGHAVKVAVFDPVSGDPWASYDAGNGIGPYGELHCQTYTVYGLDYYTDTASWRQRIVNLIQSVPDSFPVMVMSHRNTFVEDWEEPLYQAFESIGSSQIRSLQNARPYIIFGKKGASIGSAQEVLGSSQNAIIQLKDSISTKWNEGWVQSPLIGPASVWHSAHWRVSSSDSIQGDQISLSILGIRADGSTDTLINGLPTDSADISGLASRIPANTYPHLRLLMRMRDDSLHTPAYIDRWQVLYTPVPETAIDPQSAFEFRSDTLIEGESLFLRISTRNISELAFPDSLSVRYWIVDSDRKVIPLLQRKLGLHPPGSVLSDTLSWKVRGLKGQNSLWVEFNPTDSISGLYLQQELTHLNNLAELPFYVNRDITPPLLDVTFDGVHILDGEIVSAKPFIRIALKDENSFIPTSDTSAFRVMLQYPGESNGRRIYFMEGGIENMRFIPAALPYNEAIVEFNPELLIDGKYTLTVQAKDMADNQSGSNDYRISFEVINKMSITEVLNWPNPFSTSTRFVFTLTGSTPPDELLIQIMTITGVVVKEIDLDELGPVHVGRNITEYAWDGRDTYGDPLANGVYLYRVTARYNGLDVEKSLNQASRYFTRGIGKMYLMR